MKATPWITYRTRFLVTARQLTNSLSFTDSLGRQHSGRKGDYLVESSDGVLRIAPRQIFEDIYVPLSGPANRSEPPVETPQSGARALRSLPSRSVPLAPCIPSHLAQKKSPQPERVRRTLFPGAHSV